MERGVVGKGLGALGLSERHTCPAAVSGQQAGVSLGKIKWQMTAGRGWGTGARSPHPTCPTSGSHLALLVAL